MPVIRHQRPAEGVEPKPTDGRGEQHVELDVVAFVQEDRLAITPAREDVVDRTFYPLAMRSRHPFNVQATAVHGKACGTIGTETAHSVVDEHRCLTPTCDLTPTCERDAAARSYAEAVEIVRPTAERLDETLALLRASDIAVYGDSDWTAHDLREEWDGLDLEHDAWLVEIDGRLAGVAHLLERRAGRYIGDAYVHPELTGLGVGARVLALLEGRVLELRSDWPGGETIVLEVAHLVGDERAPVLLASRGFDRARSFFRMVTDVSDPQPDPAWPHGVELRPFEPEEHGRLLHEAELEAFADEWDYVPRGFDDWYESVVGEGRFDPSLSPVAWSGEQVAGFARNHAKRNGDWGWIAILGVRPAWRRRGLGLALLRESFRRFRGTGETTVALGVDVDNPTGATRLYERAGMRVLWRADVWQKELGSNTPPNPE